MLLLLDAPGRPIHVAEIVGQLDTESICGDRRSRGVPTTRRDLQAHPDASEQNDTSIERVHSCTAASKRWRNVTIEDIFKARDTMARIFRDDTPTFRAAGQLAEQVLATARHLGMV